MSSCCWPAAAQRTRHRPWPSTSSFRHHRRWKSLRRRFRPSPIPTRGAWTWSKPSSAFRSRIPIAGWKITSAPTAKSAHWVDAENQATNAFLDTLPARKALQQRLAQLFNYERYTGIQKQGGRYFYARNSGLQNQAVLYERDRVDGPERVLVDPNPWSKDGATALAEWKPNEQGTKLLYAVQDGGTDWRTLKVRDVASGNDTSDAIKWAKFTDLTWAKDGRVSFTPVLPSRPPASSIQGSSSNQQIYFHKLGTAQTADRLIYATPSEPGLYHFDRADR